MDVIGIGAMNMDHLYSVRNLVIDSEDIVDEFELYPGGSSANTIYALGRLGARCGFIGVVGNDPDGKALIASMESAGVETQHIRVDSVAPTGAVLGLSDRTGRRSLYVAAGANNRLNESDIDTNYLNTSTIVHMSSFVKDDLFSLLVDSIRKLSRDVKFSFSPGSLYSSKGMKALSPLLERTDVLFINRTELEAMSGTSYTKGAWDCIKRGCSKVVVTLGRGLQVTDKRTIASYIRDSNREYQVDAIKMEWQPVIETTGAGDAFAAGFLFGYLKGKTLNECAVAGDIVAHFSIGKKGARSGLPASDELSKYFFEATGEKF
jgi:ribokinase